MPSAKALQTGEFCPTYGEDTPASRLTVMLARPIPTALDPDPVWEEKGKYCESCLPGQEALDRILYPNFLFKSEAFVLRPVEGVSFYQTRK